MSVWTLLLWLPLIVAIPSAVVLARKLQLTRPDWSKPRRVALAALPSVLLTLVLGVAFAIKILMTPMGGGEVDSGGMALVAVMAMTPIYALLVLTLGLVAARMTLSGE